MVKVAIVGATGYTALELIKLLLNHPQAEIAALCTPPGRLAADRDDPPLAFGPAQFGL